MTAIDRRYSVAEGTAIKAPCRVATTANITLAGLQIIDGVQLVEHDRVLVKDQTDATQNGIREASSGPWPRTKDFDGAYDIVSGSRVLARYGSTNGLTEYIVAATDPITIGTSSITFLELGRVLDGGNSAYATALAVAAASVPAAITALRTFGYSAVADGGHAEYYKNPSAVSGDPGVITTANGLKFSVGDTFYNVLSYGPVDTPAHTDATILKALNAAVALPGRLIFPGARGGRVYSIIEPLRVTGVSAISFEGDGRGVSILRRSSLSPTTQDSIIQLTTSGQCWVRKLTLDQNNMKAAGDSAVTGVSMDTLEISDCDILHCLSHGVGFNSVLNARVLRNRISRDARQSNLVNWAVNVSSGGGSPGFSSAYVQIEDNDIAKFGVLVDAGRTRIINNAVIGAGYGAGIATNVGTAPSYEHIVAFNHCMEGTGIDADGTAILGMEIGGPRSIVVGNICGSNYGAGISLFAGHSILANNICYNNGQYTTADASKNPYGIALVNAAADADASESALINNRCFDTSGPGGTQEYGIAFLPFAGALTGITISGRRALQGNVLGDIYNRQDDGNSIEPLLMHYSTTFDLPSILAGADREDSFTIPGVATGDFVQAGPVIAHAGMFFTGRADTNSVTLQSHNRGGSPLDLGSAVYNFQITRR